MCTKNCTRGIKKYAKCIIYLLIRHFISIITMISKISLYKWVCICVVFLILIFTSTWESNNNSLIHISKNPVILWWTSGFPSTSETRYCPNNIQCDIYSDKNKTVHFYVEAYLFYASMIDFDDLPLPKRPDDIWGLYHEESPRNVEVLLHEKALQLFNYSSTFSRYSDVPFPLQYLISIEDITTKKYFVPTIIKSSFTKLAPVLYLQSDCETSSERDAYVAELMKFIDVDSYGTCLNNNKMPKELQEDYLNKLNNDDFLEFIARYKFIIAIENGVCEDYVTEKLWRAIKVGSVPIYFGSPSIKDWLPNRESAVLLEDHPTPEVMATYLKRLINNDSLYESHLEHKTKNIISNDRLINELIIRPYQTETMKIIETFECFVCQKIHDKKWGLLKPNIITKNHYNCPTPISALTLSVNPKNSWVFSWKEAKNNVEAIYNKVIGY